MAKYELEVLTVQDTKQTGNDIMQVAKYKMFKSGNGNRYFGTGFIVSRRMSQLFVEFKPISERMCYIRLRSTYRKISIANVHAQLKTKIWKLKMNVVKKWKKL